MCVNKPIDKSLLSSLLSKENAFRKPRDRHCLKYDVSFSPFFAAKL